MSAKELREPRSLAGQEMESWLREPEDYGWGRKVTAAIVAIETEIEAETAIRYEGVADAALAVLDEWDTFGPTGTQDTLDTHKRLRAALDRLRGLSA
jgi:hypothetical protein